MKFNEIYTLEKLNSDKSRLRAFWNEKGKTCYSGYTALHEYRQHEDPEQMAENACRNILANQSMKGINIPRVMCDFGTTSTAEYFGGKAYQPEGCKKWIDPIIHSIEDIKKIEVKPSYSLDLLKAHQLWKEVSKRLETDNLSSSFIDIQGPLNTLSLMWEQSDLMMAMYDYPEKVHEALEIVTEKLTDIVKTQLNLKMNTEAPLWPYIWLPEDIGVTVTEDYMPLLSPALYQEFGIPYLKRFAEQFKGIFIHCCGMFSQHIDSLRHSGINIIGMEFVYPNIDIDRLFNSFGSSAVFVPNIMDNAVYKFGSVAAYYRYINSIRKKETRLWYIINAWADDILEQSAFLDSICDAGE